MGGNRVKDYSLLTGKEVLRLAKEESGLTEEQIAQRLGVSLAIVKRYFNAHDAYLPSLEMSRRLSKVLGNDILVRWLNTDTPSSHKKELYRKEILSGLARAAAAFDELCRLVGEEPDSSSVREIQEGVDRLVEELGRIEEALYGEIFLPLKKQTIPPCPWWKFWRRRR